DHMANHKQVKDRVDALEMHIRDLTSKTTVDSVTKKSFYSYRHANRLFKLLKGESINAYANKIRIQTSAEYLKYTSVSIFEIALEVGYESTAAFSKAFKKLYGQSPSAFRRQKASRHQFKPTGEVCFTLTFFEEKRIQVVKTAICPGSTFGAYHRNTQSAFEALKTDAEALMLLWYEDPGLCKVAESPYFVGVDVHQRAGVENGEGTISIQGRYAIFDATFLEAFAYEVWHELIYLLVEWQGHTLRKAPYLEWFSTTALESVHTFSPDKVGIPIQ
ncbi:MAG: helix-turn-helix transcriptional regulator, partial [Bacteroidota bacterium]